MGDWTIGVGCKRMLCGRNGTARFLLFTLRFVHKAALELALSMDVLALRSQPFDADFVMVLGGTGGERDEDVFGGGVGGAGDEGVTRSFSDCRLSPLPMVDEVIV